MSKIQLGTEPLGTQPVEPGGWACWKTLLGGVVHDFNNLLQVILAMATIAKQSIERGHTAQANLDVIEQCAVRAAALGHKLQAFTNPDQRSQDLVDLNNLLKDACRVLRAAELPVGQLEVSAEDKPVWVMANASELLRAILDLCEGACPSEGRAGTLKLALEHAKTTATSCLHVTVDERTDPRAAEAVAKSHASQQRAGEIVESHGGRLDVLPGGARRVELELTLPTVQDGASPSSESGWTEGAEMHAAMREILSGMLRELGCVVHKVSQGSSEKVEATA